jgi:hypothetical protein
MNWALYWSFDVKIAIISFYLHIFLFSSHQFDPKNIFMQLQLDSGKNAFEIFFAKDPNCFRG